MTTRRILRMTAFLLFICLALPACSQIPATDTAASGKDSSSTVEFFAMDTYMTITAYGDQSDKAVAAAKERVIELENVLSRTIANSEVSAINRSAGGEPALVSKGTADLIAEGLRYGALTDGAFDITIAPIMDLWGFSTGSNRVPSQAEIDSILPLVDYSAVTVDTNKASVQLPRTGMCIDLGGIAKGYASDEVLRVLANYPLTGAMISLGGNVAAAGQKPSGGAWRIAITDPQDPAAYLGVLTHSACSVITSGGYERFFEENGKKYIHIMDPKTGSPVESDLLSVTIVTDSGVMGDSLSTALFVMGKSMAIEYWRVHKDFSFILCDTDGHIYVTEDLADSFQPTDPSRTTETVAAEAAK